MKKLSTFAVLFLAIVTFAQTYNISLNLKKGETYYTLTDIKMDMLQKVMGQEMPMKINMLLGLSFNVLEAQKNTRRLEVRERIYDDKGQNYTDVSHWYWAAFWGQTKGPWWSITTVSVKELKSE